MSALQRARDYYRRQRTVTLAALRAARRQVLDQPDDAFGLARTIANYQLASATLASRTMAAEADRAPYVDPMAFVGRNALGFPLIEPVQTLIDDLAVEIEARIGVATLELLGRIDRMVASEITDAGRAAASVEIFSEPDWTNYVRVLNPPSCARCAILAGRIYRDLDGFKRHPLCDCQHWPVTSWEEAHDEGLLFSARDAFGRGQIGSQRPDGTIRPGLSESDAKAIRDGADIAQVVNASQGMATASIFGRDGVKVTLASTTKRSAWRKANPDRPVRLRPESIYDLAKDRDDALRLLRLYGYLKDDADVPTDNGGAGGSGGGPPPALPAPEPDPDDWEARRAALSTDTHGDPLEHHEIEFIERFERRGESIRWIPQERSTSTNDFIWPDQGGVEVELKSTKARYESITGRILDAASRALRNHQVVKDTFLIDLGVEELDDELRGRLEAINVGRRKYHVVRLWVLSDDGDQLEEINLRT